MSARAAMNYITVMLCFLAFLPLVLLHRLPPSTATTLSALTRSARKMQSNEVSLRAADMATMIAISRIRSVVARHNISSLLYAPCGAMEWQPTLLEQLEEDNPNLHFIGLDKDSTLIEENKIKYSQHTNWEFVTQEMSDALPLNVDLVVAGIAQQNLSCEHVAEALQNIARSQPRFLLVGSHSSKNVNQSHKPALSSHVNLREGPYNLESGVLQVFSDFTDNPRQKDGVNLLLFSGKYLATIDFDAMKRRCKMERHTRSLRVRVSSPSDLTGTSDIPRFIHQSWKDESVPSQYQQWQASWKELHPKWQYILWTDAMNQRLVEEHFSWFLDTYNTFPLEIYRADSARYMYMYKFGGVYADLDFRALKPMDELLKGRKQEALVGRLSEDNDWQQNVPNAWMASSPGHPFWLYCLLEIARGAHLVPGKCDGEACTRNMLVEQTTGPWMLLRSVRKFQKDAASNDGTLTILEPSQVYPLNWNAPYAESCIKDSKLFNETACFGDAYAVTFWSHSWGR